MYGLPKLSFKMCKFSLIKFNTMKNITFSFLLLCFTLSVSAQNKENAISSFNGFQRTKSKYPDSAITYLKYLVALEPNSAADLIHNSFSQSFLNVFSEKKIHDTAFLAMLKQRNLTLDSALAQINTEKKKANLILLNLQREPDIFIKQNIYPISEWVNAQNNKKNSDELLKIGNKYIDYLTKSDDVYAERKARYGLLIWQLMANRGDLQSTRDKILELVYNKLKDQQSVENSNDLTYSLKEKRAWYRYMFAYTNFILAQNASQKEKVAYLKLAYQYSPDNLDKTVSNAYFYDMIFLFGEEKKSFEEDYLAELGNEEEKYNTLIAMSMNDPSFKSKAKTFSKNATDFNNIWLTEFNKASKTAPIFSLNQTNGLSYTLGNTNKNQWTLIDFWGTWCGPCRKEHPDLENLYQRTKNGDIPKLNIITIASRDKEIAVKEYMREFKYNFPVAMSDNKIEGTYNVSSWPSKFLVSPQGKYVVIPFNVNWVKYIEDYIN